jgi:hypothetical protein
MKIEKSVREFLRKIGTKGGKSVSPEKQKAARENGCKGGRPPLKPKEVSNESQG